MRLVEDISFAAGADTCSGGHVEAVFISTKLYAKCRGILYCQHIVLHIAQCLSTSLILKFMLLLVSP